MQRIATVNSYNREIPPGQHYDPNMSDIFFRELGMPEEINRKLTDAISDLLFVKGGRAAEWIADIQLRQ